MNSESLKFPIIVNLNGIIQGPEDSGISPLNRGFLYGDAVYEVWRSYADRVFAWQPHLDRLRRSAKAIHLAIPWADSELFEQIKNSARAFRSTFVNAGDLYIRLQIYRGNGPIGLSTGCAGEAGFVVLIKSVPVLSQHHLDAGLNLTIATTIRRNPIEALSPAWKTGNYLNNIVGLHEAESRGADDVLFLNLKDELTESSTSNIAFFDGNTFVTPPVSAGILPGITRSKVLGEVAKNAGFDCEERTIRPSDLAAFEEAFLLSTTKDIQPVGRIDSHCFATGSATHTRRLKQAFQAHAMAYADLHAELKV